LAVGEPAKKTAQVILIPKELRAEWMDVIALDPSVSHVEFRAAGIIGSHFNRHTGNAFLTLERLARLMKVSGRTAWAAVRGLERAGYLIVKRRELGTFIRKEKKTGTETTVRLAGGKGVANTYFPAFERSQVTATNMGSKLAVRCDLLWEQRSQNPASKVAAGCEPTLSSSSKKNPTAAASFFGPEADLLKARIGNDVFKSWFGNGQVVLKGADNGVLRLGTSKKFFQREVLNRFEGDLLQCFKKCTSIEFEIER